MRKRRYYKAGACYEICFRAKDSLPFVAYKVIRLLIGSAVARAQRDDKFIISHDIWNGSHPHIIGKALDGKKLVRFYEEVEKKITDSLKCLLGLDKLSIWEGRPMVAMLPDLETVKQRVAYLYANPAQDNLEDSIDDFPGYSSWTEFNRAQNTVDALTVEEFPWIRLPTIPVISDPTLGEAEDRRLTRLLIARNKHRQKLIRKPNNWMTCFGVSRPKDVAEINKEIRFRIRQNEAAARELRKQSGKTILGANALRNQPILKAHTPKKHGRKIFVICSNKELRIRIIQEHKEFDAICRDCFLRASRGERVVWPPGAFIPPIPPLANALAT